MFVHRGRDFTLINNQNFQNVYVVKEEENCKCGETFLNCENYRQIFAYENLVGSFFTADIIFSCYMVTNVISFD